MEGMYEVDPFTGASLRYKNRVKENAPMLYLILMSVSVSLCGYDTGWRVCGREVERGYKVDIS